mmetsp:Transcript_135430/g.234922  ORF Transcript_135430/g.234922 Transcript_135430/m.234922 type:complete len:292 (-) Transcript_135430:165-1040(-)
MLHGHLNNLFYRMLNEPLNRDVHGNFYKLLHHFLHGNINMDMYNSLNRNFDHLFHNNFVGYLDMTNLAHNFLHWNFSDHLDRNPNKLFHNVLPGPLHDMFHSPGNWNPNHLLDDVFMRHRDFLYLLHNALSLNVYDFLNDVLLFDLDDPLNGNRLLHLNRHNPLNRVGYLHFTDDGNLNGNLNNSFDVHNLLQMLGGPTNLDDVFHWPFDGFCDGIRNPHFDRHRHNHFSLAENFLGHLHNSFLGIWHLHLHRNFNPNFDGNLDLHRNMSLTGHDWHAHVLYMFKMSVPSH